MQFNHQGTIPDRPDMFLTGITDIAVVQSTQGPVLYTTSRLGGGDLVAFRIGADGGLVFLDSRAIAGSTQAGAVNRLTVTEGGLFLTGAQNAAVTHVALAADGKIGSASAVTGAAFPSPLMDTVVMDAGGQTYLYGIARGAETISVWRLNANGTVSHIEGSDPGNAALSGLASISGRVLAGVPTLLVADGAGNALVRMTINASGQAREVSRLSAADGVGISNPTATAFAEVGGTVFGIVGAADSGTLSVVQLGSDGTMRLTDHVLDTLDTRFDGVHLIETLTHNGRAFLAAAGGDDGVSVFELSPDGRLIHMETLVDAVDTTLDAVSALSLSVVGGILHLAVAAGGEAGLTVFTADIDGIAAPIQGTAGADVLTGTALDDYISGAAGNDKLLGADGADIISDGAGADLLFGGADADTFVFSDDGQPDTIGDFDLTQDRIDLSGWAFLRSAGQLVYEGTSNGAILTFGSETLEIRTANGKRLSAEQIEGLDLIGQSRFLPSWVLPDQPDTETAPGVPTPLNLIGTPQVDTLTGGMRTI